MLPFLMVSLVVGSQISLRSKLDPSSGAVPVLRRTDALRVVLHGKIWQPQREIPKTCCYRLDIDTGKSIANTAAERGRAVRLRHRAMWQC